MRPRQRERRKGLDGVPDSLETYLNQSQLLTLQQIENFGWSLKYVRRPLFMEPVPVLYHREMNTYAVIEMDGSLNKTVDVAVRH